MEERPVPLALKIVAFIMFVFLLAPVVLVVPISWAVVGPSGGSGSLWVNARSTRSAPFLTVAETTAQPYASKSRANTRAKLLPHRGRRHPFTVHRSAA